MNKMHKKNFNIKWLLWVSVMIMITCLATLGSGFNGPMTLDAYAGAASENKSGGDLEAGTDAYQEENSYYGQVLEDIVEDKLAKKNK